MKYLICIIFILVLLVGPVLAGQQYNPFTRRWETVPQGYQLKYNPFGNNWSYQHPGARQEYNPFEKRWDWSPPPVQRGPIYLPRPYNPYAAPYNPYQR